MKTKHIHIIALACGALLFAAGCKVKTTGHSELTASSGGRDIHVSVDGAAFVQPQENAFTVKVTGHEIVIDRERVLVDKTIHAPVPAGTKKFEVIYQGGVLAVKGDGAMIMETPFNR